MIFIENSRINEMIDEHTEILEEARRIGQDGFIGCSEGIVMLLYALKNRPIPESLGMHPHAEESRKFMSEDLFGFPELT